MSKSFGFTLIELLVTVSIIAILSAIGLVIYSSAMQQGRDSKRQSDLRSIQSALEQYYADQLFYPTASGLDALLTPSSPPAFTNQIGNPTSPPPSPKTYLNVPPQDWQNRYQYQAAPSSCNNSSTSCITYCLFAKLESPPSPIPSLPSGCSYPASYNFAVTSP